MSTMTPFVEYILSKDRSNSRGGGKLARLGGVLTSVPIFPPGMTVTYQIFPYFNAFANFEFWHRWSPAIVPNTIYWRSEHRGMTTLAGLISNVTNAEGHNWWLEVTQSQPIVTTITNVTAANQFFETVDTFLIVDTEDCFWEIKELAEAWGGRANLAQVEETNRLLKKLAREGG